MKFLIFLIFLMIQIVNGDWSAWSICTGYCGGTQNRTNEDNQRVQFRLCNLNNCKGPVGCPDVECIGPICLGPQCNPYRVCRSTRGSNGCLRCICEPCPPLKCDLEYTHSTTETGYQRAYY